MHISSLQPSRPLSSPSAADQAQPVRSFAQVYDKADFKPVPNQIHMVWVGSQPGQTQQDYLRQWAAKNPGSEVNLWVDSKQFGAYAANREVRQQVDKLFPDAGAFQAEKLFRGLFSQLAAALGKEDGALGRAAQKQALSELNKELAAPGNEAWREALLPQGGKVTGDNAAAALDAFRQLVRGNDEKFLLADRLILDQTVKAWDRCAAGAERDVAALERLQAGFADAPNVKVRDLSHAGDIQLRNRDAYQHEIIGRNGAYPAASDIARYEILHNYGGVYADIDLECTQPLAGALSAHPDLMLVGLAEGKREASGSATPYFANALLASHPGSKMLDGFIDKIGRDYQQMKGAEFAGDRYFSRANKSTIEGTGPNALRGHVDAVLREAEGRPEAARGDAQSLAERIWSQDDARNHDFWAAMDTHFRFPDGLVNFETEEQQQSATKGMA
ncbi:TcdA/TcdB catalytic glycosyltransferase domain-containing protein [Chromobacterium subtsugae]|uniref:TcdA/TcdB catalytic glycosyltransferase domain-containing protein n=1 Tax=Chromobacterium subtsugae TaxID=251747 RepID=UPI000640E788|nr:TcdA/TcdB catalytic glycosyltransferase domain-containing protein [Chromobacterium subtsugae]